MEMVANQFRSLTTLTAFLDGAFAKQIVNNLKLFQGLQLLSECKFSQGERYFGSNCQVCSKNLSSKSWKNTCEEVDFFKLQARNLQLYKKQGNS